MKTITGISNSLEGLINRVALLEQFLTYVKKQHPSVYTEFFSVNKKKQ